MTAQFSAETRAGEFIRQPNSFTDRITRDCETWPVEPGRYRLIWSRACPWAHRSVIVRGLLGLSDAISLGTVDPVRDERGWRFAEPDPVLGITYLAEAYRAADPAYEGRVTVPVLVDTRSGRVVTNDFPQLTLDFSTEWLDFHRPGAPDLYPADLRPGLDALMRDIYTDVNNGVYRAGFATSQEAYDAAHDALFARLDALQERLSDDRRYLMGDRLTEADVRLFTTLARFDPVYHGHFKCNRSKLDEMPVLWAYARDLFQTPGFGERTTRVSAYAKTTHPRSLVNTKTALDRYGSGP